MNQKKMVCMILVIGIIADGTWRGRGYSSSYGVVTGMSLITGKVLDVEVMSKECWECITWSSKKSSEEFEHWWEGHQHNCSNQGVRQKSVTRKQITIVSAIPHEKPPDKYKNKRKKIRQRKKAILTTCQKRKLPNMKLGHFES
jgi:hypothetical protein